MKNGFAALFASGLVRFLDSKLDEATLRALITCNGSEVVAADRLPSPLRRPRKVSLWKDRTNSPLPRPAFPSVMQCEDDRQRTRYLEKQLEPRGTERTRRLADRVEGPPDDSRRD